MRDKFEKTVGKAGGKLREGLDKTREAASATYEVGSDYVNKVTAVPETLESWCSWCGEFTRHDLETKRKLSRSTYYCTGCENPTIPCRYCDNMAMAAAEPPAEGELVTETDEPVVLDEEELLDEGEAESSANMRQRLSRFLKSNWNHELCAEHNGAIPSFEKAKARINDLDEFAELMKPEKRNIYGTGKKVALAAGGVGVVGTGAWALAPGVAAAVGSWGLLGAASTGTSISTLSGAALTSASVAKVGTAGLATVAAVGSSLGGHAGYGLANAYLKDVPDFEFVPLKNDEGQDSGHRVIVINGYLTEKQDKAEDWLAGIESHLSDSQLWYLRWESKTLLKLGELICFRAGNGGLSTAIATGAKKGSKVIAKKAGLAGGVLTAAYLANSAWYSAMLNAQKTGALLAEAISRTDGKTFTIIGHSLGARVAYYALESLGTKEGEKRVRNAVLLGGAVGVDDNDAWNIAAAAVEGNIYNCIARDDLILRGLYQTANLFISKPAGINEVGHDIDNLFNIDCSNFVNGHTKWKENLPRVVEQLELEL